MIASMIAGGKLTALLRFQVPCGRLSGAVWFDYRHNAYMYLIRNVSPALATSFAHA